MCGPKLFLTYLLNVFTYLLNVFFIVMLHFFHSRSRSRVFFGMIASDSRSQNVGMDFFHSLPFPEFWECFFYSPPVPKFREWVFSIPFPFPNFGNGIIHSRSCSRTLKCHSCSPLESSVSVGSSYQ